MMISNKIEANNPLRARLQVMRAYMRAYEQFALSMHAALTNCSQLLRKDVPIGSWIGALLEINGAQVYIGLSVMAGCREGTRMI